MCRGNITTIPSIRKKTVGKEQYYYLEHSCREDGKVHKKEKYLGRTLPKNIEELKQQLLFEVYTKHWFTKFDLICVQFQEQAQRTPPTARKKELETFATRSTYDTNRIEGSTLTPRETADLLEKGITPAARPLSDVKERKEWMRINYQI